MRIKKTIRSVFCLQSAACVLSTLTQTIGRMVDRVFIGQCLGVKSIAAFGIISPLMFVLTIFGSFIATGSRNHFTRLSGEGDLEKAKGIFSLSMILSVGFATLMMALILSAATPLTCMLGATGHAMILLPKARNYLIGVAAGLPAMNAMQTLNKNMVNENDPNLPIIACAVLVAADILFNLIDVFVVHGGTLGMGLATSISYYVALAAIILFQLRKEKTILKFSFIDIPWRETGKILSQGAPTAVRLTYRMSKQLFRCLKEEARSRMGLDLNYESEIDDPDFACAA